MASPGFGMSVSPILTRRRRLCPPNNTGTPGFSNLPSALIYQLVCENSKDLTGEKELQKCTRLCHVIYYHGDKKYPCLVGIVLMIIYVEKNVATHE
jgi:hypothetical protein